MGEQLAVVTDNLIVLGFIAMAMISSTKPSACTLS
jgi:hypothetical protein